MSLPIIYDADYECHDFARALPTNSPLPPNEGVFRDLIDDMIKKLFSKGKLPSQIHVHCKRSGPTQGVPKENLTATLILKTFVKKDGYV